MSEEILDLRCGASPREGLKSLATHERPWRDGGAPPLRPPLPGAGVGGPGEGRGEGSLPLVKICGVTSVEDALLAVSLGASHLGLNFYPPSPRCLEPAVAREIAEAVRGRVELVGVFVDRPRVDLEAIDSAVVLDLLQFHGSETPEDLAPFGSRAIKVFRLRPEDSLPDLGAFPAAWGFLFDVWHPALQGGTGEGWDFSRLVALPRDRPILVAGGIRPGNVAAALTASGAAGVDVCSGVESAPGRKDPELLAQLFREVQHHAGIA